MTECCTSSDESPKKYRCPVNGKEYGSVGVKTILHHLHEAWEKDLPSKAYYFCSDKDCEIVYFGQDDSVISKTELRTTVGIKETNPNRLICYCFGIPFSAAYNNSAILDFVKDNTKKARCSCETSNPSGRCCLKDFPD